MQNWDMPPGLLPEVPDADTTLRMINTLMLAGKEDRAKRLLTEHVDFNLKQQREMAAAQKKAFDRALLDGLAKVEEAQRKQLAAERRFKALFQSINHTLMTIEKDTTHGH